MNSAKKCEASLLAIQELMHILHLKIETENNDCSNSVNVFKYIYEISDSTNNVYCCVCTKTSTIILMKLQFWS